MPVDVLAHPPLLPACFVNLNAVRWLVRDALGCGCGDEVFDDVVVGSPTVFRAPGPQPMVEIVVGRRLLVALVVAASLSNLEEDARALLVRGHAAREEHGLNRFRLVLVGPLPPAVLERLQAHASRIDDRTHVHQLRDGDLRSLSGPWQVTARGGTRA